jgi:phage baseplate assembly protein W
MMQSPRDFIGTGFSFPLKVAPTGQIMLQSGNDKIESSIRMILSTAPGERVMRPEFGCAIWRQIFDPIDANTLSEMVRNVRRAVARWEPRVELENVIAEPEEDSSGLVSIQIEYVVKATNDRRNLVYPFYIIPGEGD